mmetsp:Transcript_22731/g.56112  ORF Transcript_22731/g.56112 Transcript_22731/m.56112 type:complete len:274 (-) Transcript_22731:89-910(-)
MPLGSVSTSLMVAPTLPSLCPTPASGWLMSMPFPPAAMERVPSATLTRDIGPWLGTSLIRSSSRVSVASTKSGRRLYCVSMSLGPPAPPEPPPDPGLLSSTTSGVTSLSSGMFSSVWMWNTVSSENVTPPSPPSEPRGEPKPLLAELRRLLLADAGLEPLSDDVLLRFGTEPTTLLRGAVSLDLRPPKPLSRGRACPPTVLSRAVGDSESFRCAAAAAERAALCFLGMSITVSTISLMARSPSSNVASTISALLKLRNTDISTRSRPISSSSM